MTEEIEAHVLKKYEILQKLGKLFRSNSHVLLACPPIQLELSPLGQEHQNIGLFLTYFARN